MSSRAELLSELMHTRRSVRRFTAELPSAGLIERVLRDALSAPSASNKQPWRFYVIQARSMIDAMAQAVRASIEQIAASVPSESEPAFRAYGDYFTRFEAAPLVIAPICRGPQLLSNLCDETLASETRASVAAMERDSALVSTALALENLLLSAHANGLGASAMTGPLVAAPRLRALLSVPDSWSLVALVPLGYAAEVPQTTERKQLEAVVRWVR